MAHEVSTEDFLDDTLVCCLILLVLAQVLLNNLGRTQFIDLVARLFVIAVEGFIVTAIAGISLGICAKVYVVVVIGDYRATSLSS